MENKFDTQFLIEGHDLDEDAIHDGILNSAKGDCLLVVGDDDVVKVHYHTDTPWKVLEYAATQGDIHTIIIENMEASVQRPARLILFKMFKVSSLTFFSKKVRNPR